MSKVVVHFLMAVSVTIAVLLLSNAGSLLSAKAEEAAQGAAMVEIVVPSELSDQAQIGKTGFDAVCASCHGPNAVGQMGVAPPLIHKIYEPSHHGDGSFLLAAKQGVRAHHWPFGNMPPVQGVSQGDVKNIIAYIRELQRANGIE